MTLAPHITNSKPQTTRANALRRGATGKHAHADSFQKSRDGSVDPNWMKSYQEARIARTPGCDGGDPRERYDGVETDLSTEEWLNSLSPTIQEELEDELGFMVAGQMPIDPALFCPCESESPYGYMDAMDFRVRFDLDPDYWDQNEVGCGRRTPRRFPDATVAIEFYAS